jgi:hypothetical protein
MHVRDDDPRDGLVELVGDLAPAVVHVRHAEARVEDGPPVLAAR